MVISIGQIIKEQKLIFAISVSQNKNSIIKSMNTFNLTLAGTDPKTFPQACNRLISELLNGTLLDFTIRQYLNDIFKCVIKYNHHQSVSLLLHLPWFTHKFKLHIDILYKILRWYSAKGQQCAIVCYTLLIEGFISAEHQTLVIQTTLKFLQDRYDHIIFLNTLKEAYPHKNRPLEHHLKYIKSCLLISQRKPSLRASIMEIIIQQLSSFDTEIKAGDSFINSPFYNQSSQICADYQLTEMQVKLDALLVILLEYIDTHTQIKDLTQQLLLIFHQKVLLLDRNKYIQYIMFYITESQKQVSGYFLSILMNTMLEEGSIIYQKAYINNLFYLGSYMVRSSISRKKLKNAMKQMICYAYSLVKSKPDLAESDSLLSEVLLENKHFLYIYQTILYVFIHKPQIYKDLVFDFQPLLQYANKKCFSDTLINSEVLYRFRFTCRRWYQQYQRAQVQYMSFECKFIPILLQNSRLKIQPFYIESYENCNNLEELGLPGKRKRLSSTSARIGKKLKMFSQQPISDASTMYNRYIC